MPFSARYRSHHRPALLFKHYLMHSGGKLNRRMQHKNYGLIIDPIQPEDFVLGSAQSLEARFGETVINPEGDWLRFTPSTEDQSARNGDTWACVSFATLNAVEMLARA